ncbi:MAG TPA: hypothetical protein VEI97_14085 [bacterium]|nr:hypothetical protein [bacterium]
MTRPMLAAALALGLAAMALPSSAHDTSTPAELTPLHPTPPGTAEATFATRDTDPAPTIEIVSPTEGQSMAAGQSVMLEVNLSEDGIVLRDKSYHVHVWVDDRPYAAMYDATKPFEIKDLGEGSHSIRVAPSRPWHETFKNEGAYDAVNLTIGAADGFHTIDHSKPTLTYSRPKKNHVHTWAESRNLIFDWYLSGITLGQDGAYLRITVDGNSYLVTSWAPIFFENPPAGEHTVMLELLRNGELIDANYNPFTATFTIQPPDALADAKVAGDPHAGH